MKIAVTGASGFVGSHLVQELSKQGHAVFSFDRSGLRDHYYWDIESGPYQNPAAVDVVIHSAARVNDWSSYKESHRGNVIGTANALTSFEKVPLFIFISSASVYDPFTHESILTEESKCGNYLNAYSKTKHEAELLVMKSSQERRVILRPHIIYGKGDKKILPRLLKARRFGKFMVIGNGKNLISLTHIENLTHAVLCCLSSSLPGYHIFNVADEETPSVDELLLELKRRWNIPEPFLHIPRGLAFVLGLIEEQVYRLVGSKKPPLITRYVVAQMGYSHRLSISKAQKILHYKPTWNYKKGFQELAP